MGARATVLGAVVLLGAAVAAAQDPDPVQHFTARATNGEVKLEWENAETDYGPSATTKVCIDTGPTPIDPTACTEVTNQAITPGGYDTYTYANGNGTYYFSAFTSVSPEYSDSRDVRATPFLTSGPEKWRYSTGAASVTAPAVRPGGIGTGAVYGVSNDNSLHAMNPTAAGGDWPQTAPYSWLPVAMNGPVLHRPVLVPLAAGAVALLASEDGYGYCVDVETGTLVWQTSSQLGEGLAANPTGLFSEFTPDAPDLVFFGTRNTGSANELVAVDNATGVVDASYTFTNSSSQGGDDTGIGIITGTAVDPLQLRVYFTSRAASGGSSDTIWAVDMSKGAAEKVWSRPLGDIDSGPNVYLGTVYVGTNSGVVYSLDATTSGATNWSFDTGDGTVKVGVFRDFTQTPLRLYVTTTTQVWALDDSGSAVTEAWHSDSAAVPSPSMAVPLYGDTEVLVADGDGHLLLLDESDGSVVGSVPLAGAGVIMGSPVVDNVNDMAIVGDTAGVYHAVDLTTAWP